MNKKRSYNLVSLFYRESCWNVTPWNIITIRYYAYRNYLFKIFQISLKYYEFQLIYVYKIINYVKIYRKYIYDLGRKLQRMCPWVIFFFRVRTKSVSVSTRKCLMSVATSYTDTYCKLSDVVQCWLSSTHWKPYYISETYDKQLL